MKVLLIDNYDSFTYNLYQYVGEILEREDKTFSLEVHRNDKIGLNEIKKMAPSHIIISPGPGDPSDRAYFGVCADVILKLGKTIPTLGVCLGMQGIAHYFGGNVVRARTPMHGKTSIIGHDAKGIFTTVPQHIEVMRYHSLVVTNPLPKVLEVSARTVKQGEPGEIMALRHKTYPIEGVQFHPESFATDAGTTIVKNFLLEKKQ